MQPNLFDSPEPVAPSLSLGAVIDFPHKDHVARADFVERWYQTNALAEINYRLPIGGTRKNGKGEVLVCPTGGGKCLGKGTPVLMFDGTIKPVEEIETGELLMGPDSTPRRVLSLARGRENLYRVIPVKGEPYVVNESHILSLKITGGAKMGPRYLPGSIVNLSVCDYLTKSKSFKHVAKGWRAPVEWPEQSVPLDPYFLGLWLADGTSSIPCITKPDEEIQTYLEEFAVQMGCRLRTHNPVNRCLNHTVVAQVRGQKNPVQNGLRDCGVLRNKHVPLCYKANSREVRLQLLAGFLDGDGCVHRTGYDAISKSEALANDIAFIARSLGLAAYVSPCEKSWTYSGEKRAYWRIHISGDCSEFPVKIARRKAPPRTQIKDVLVTGISIEPLGEGDYYGFEIDGDHLFMLGDFTVTHNTSIASRAIAKWLDAGKRVLILVDLERLLDQMRDDLAEEGIFPLIEKAEHSALTAFGRLGNCVLASMQTLHATRLARWAADSFDYIVVDECHCFGYENIVAYFAKAQLLGLTATPLRADGRSLREFFNYPYIRTLTMREAIEGWNGNTQSYDAPFLSRIEVLPIDATHIDLSGIKIVGRDFDQRELDKRIWEHVNWLSTQIMEATKGLRPWVYTPKIQTCEALSKGLCDIGDNFLPYHSKVADPAENLKRFIQDDVRGLVNVNMLIKGVNVPKVDCIARVRATLNLAQATQEIGRGGRLSPQTGKKSCLVVEFNFKTAGKTLVGVLDAILDGADEEDESKTPAQKQEKARVREIAEKLIQSGEEPDALFAVKKAEKQLSFEQEQERKARDAERQAKHEKVEIAIDFSQKYDPFGGLNKTGSTSTATRESQPATREQMVCLEQLSGGTIKEKDIKHFTAESANKRISELENRAKYKLATEKQLKMMVDTLGMDPKKAARMKKWDASDAINNRKAEMVRELEPHGFSYEATIEKKPWEVADLYKRFCGGAS